MFFNNTELFVSMICFEGRWDNEHVLPAAEGDHGVGPEPGQGGDGGDHEGGAVMCDDDCTDICINDLRSVSELM